MAYRIWKASINEYRIEDTTTGKRIVLEEFALVNCRFMVDEQSYVNAALHEFKNSGKEDDYFAWIEAENVLVKQYPEQNKVVFYNPFKDMYFRDRGTGENLYEAKLVVVKGNKLTYWN